MLSAELIWSRFIPASFLFLSLLILTRSFFVPTYLLPIYPYVFLAVVECFCFYHSPPCPEFEVLLEAELRQSEEYLILSPFFGLFLFLAVLIFYLPEFYSLKKFGPDFASFPTTNFLMAAAECGSVLPFYDKLLLLSSRSFKI